MSLPPLSEINMALARGYCSPANARKEVDADLIDAMAVEVQKLAAAFREAALEEAANAASKISLSCAAAIRALKNA